MDKLLTNNIWVQVKELLKPNMKKIGAIAYVTDDEYLSFGKNDILICNASDYAIKNGETSAAVLYKFYKNGARLFSLSSIHSKVVVWGNEEFVLIGSSNLSKSSAEYLNELSLLSDRSQIISQAVAFIFSMIKIAQPITEDFISRIKDIPVQRRVHTQIKRKNVKTLGHRIWIVSVRPLSEEFYRDEEKFVIEGEKAASNKIEEHENIYWIRFAGNSRFRRIATEGDTVMIIENDKNGDIVVWRPKSIIYRQDNNNWTRFYFGISENDQYFFWDEFKEEIDKIGLDFITKNSVREIKIDHFQQIENMLRNNFSAS